MKQADDKDYDVACKFAAADRIFAVGRFSCFSLGGGGQTLSFFRPHSPFSGPQEREDS